MIDLIKISVNEIASYVKYIPYSIQQEYIFNEKLLLLGVQQMDIPSGVVVLERSGNAVSMLYMQVSEEIKDTEYEQEVFITALTYAEQEGYQSFAVEYQKSLKPQLHHVCEVLGFDLEDLESGYFRFRLKDLKSDILKKGKHANVKALNEVRQHTIDVITAKAKDAYELYVDAPIYAADYDADCSCLYLDKNVPKGILLAKERDGGLAVSMLYSDGTAMMAPLEMLQYMTDRIYQKYPEEMVCSVTALDDRMVAFVKKLTGLEAEYRTRAVMQLKNE